jgi:hypothetical protein
MVSAASSGRLEPERPSGATPAVFLRPRGRCCDCSAIPSTSFQLARARPQYAPESRRAPTATTTGKRNSHIRRAGRLPRLDPKEPTGEDSAERALCPAITSHDSWRPRIRIVGATPSSRSNRRRSRALPGGRPQTERRPVARRYPAPAPETSELRLQPQGGSPRGNQGFPREASRIRYLANSTLRDSRMTVTLIWPGYSSSCSMARAISCESKAASSSSISVGFTITRISRPACSA